MSPDEPPASGADRPAETSPDDERPEAPAPPDTTPLPPPPAPPVSRRPPAGRLVLGLVLVAVGVVWLLDALDVFSLSFLAVLPGALILVGLILLWGARTGRHKGLIVLGVVLMVILTIASSFDIRLRGGVGDRNERPATLADVQREYHLSVGQLTIDLRDVTFPDGRTTNLKASVGIGQLTIRLPDGSRLAVSAKGHVGAGQVMLGNRENSGLDVTVSTGFGQITRDQPRLTLDLSVGLGQVEVTR